jgi:hypothetical protein
MAEDRYCERVPLAIRMAADRYCERVPLAKRMAADRYCERVPLAKRMAADRYFVVRLSWKRVCESPRGGSRGQFGEMVWLHQHITPNIFLPPLPKGTLPQKRERLRMFQPLEESEEQCGG